mmetsp:Transcript_81367/g.262886  ORF Transcript_81367/g.262886 Transcript_81367/m.262886 type:complete len:132 (-) Transcript_81367:84-479(-)
MLMGFFAMMNALGPCVVLLAFALQLLFFGICLGSELEGGVWHGLEDQASWANSCIAIPVLRIACPRPASILLTTVVARLLAKALVSLFCSGGNGPEKNTTGTKMATVTTTPRWGSQFLRPQWPSHGPAFLL